jgi:hypothetical protein
MPAVCAYPPWATCSLSETGRHRILKTDRDGVRVDSVGRLGNGDYQFDMSPWPSIPPTSSRSMSPTGTTGAFRCLTVACSTCPHCRCRSGPDLPLAICRPGWWSIRPATIFFFDEDRHVIYRFDSNGQYELDFELFGEDGRIMPVAMAMLDDELWVAGDKGRTSPQVHLTRLVPRASSTPRSRSVPSAPAAVRSG